MRLTLLLAALLVAAKPIPMNDAMAIIDVIHAHLANSGDLDISSFAEGKYAVSFWKAEGGHAGGSALLLKAQSAWRLVKMISGSFTTAAQLEQLGVPSHDAAAFIVDLKNAH